jgi:hypothetical protein
MLFAFNIFLNLNIKNGVSGCNFGVTVKFNTLFTEKFSTVQTLGGSFSVLPIDQLADVTEREFGWLSSPDNF